MAMVARRSRPTITSSGMLVVEYSTHEVILQYEYHQIRIRFLFFYGSRQPIVHLFLYSQNHGCADHHGDRNRCQNTTESCGTAAKSGGQTR